MARASKKLVDALRKAANRIAEDDNYQWGHMGACNCGFIAQEVTKLSKGEIHEFAMRGYGDWTEQVQAFCPTSSMPMDVLISEMIAAGFSLEDLANLERLKDKEVLDLIPAAKRHKLRHNDKNDVALYLKTWAVLLESKIHQTNEEIEFV